MKKSVGVFAGLFAIMSVACSGNKADYPYKARLDEVCELIDEVRDFDSALVVLDSLLYEYPGNQDCRFERARVFWYMDRNDEALLELDYLTRNYKKDCLVFKSTMHWLKSRILFEKDDADGTIEELRNAVKAAVRDNPELVQSYKFDLANMLYGVDRMEESDNVYREMLNDDPEDSSAMLGLARNCLERKHYYAGLEWANRAAIASSYYAEVYRIRMELFYGLGMKKQTVDDAVRYVEIDDSGEIDLDFLTRMASCDCEYALDRINRKIDELEDCGFWVAWLIKMYEYNNRYEDAIDIYLQWLDEEPDNDRVHNLAANCYNLMGLYDDAIREINLALKISDETVLIGNRGAIYSDAGEYRNAVADFFKVIERGQASAVVYRNIGYCYECMGQHELAFEYYKRGISLFPEQDAYIYVLSGDCNMESGNSIAARNDYEMALQIEEKHGTSMWSAYAMMGLGQRNDAIKCLDELIEDSPQESANYYARARLLCRMGRTTQALVSLREALQHGFRSFATIEHEADLASLYGNPEYHLLMAEYNGKEKTLPSHYDISGVF